MRIFDHASAKAACVAHGRPAESKRIANNTYVEARYPDTMGNPSYAIRLHKTDIVTYHPDGRIVLSTGGWKTTVTKTRMNDNLPSSIRVYSDKGVWRVTASPVTIVLDGHALDVSYLFVDGITLEKVPGKEYSYSYRALPGTALTGKQETELLEAKRRLQRTVRGYLAGLPAQVSKWQAEMATGGLSTSGDCLYCQGIVTNIGSDTAVDNTDHLWSHLSEGYIPLTLVLRAYQHVGVSQTFFVRHIQMGLVTYLHKNLRRYLLDRLDPANNVQPKREDVHPQHYLEWAKGALEYPSDYGYMGEDETLYKASAPSWTRTRDSESLELANFEIVEQRLIAAFPDLWGNRVEDADGHTYDRDEEKGYPQIYIMRSGHWAVGWIEQIVVPVLLDKDKPLALDNLHPVWVLMCQLKEATDLYPYLEGAEDLAAEMDVTAEMDDLERTLVYLASEYGRERSTLPEATDVHWKIQELDDEYFWTMDQVTKALVAIDEEAAYDAPEGRGNPDQMELEE